VSDRSKVWLWDREEQCVVPAELIDSVDGNDIMRASATWKPLMEARVQDFTQQNIPRDQWPQHAHWDWEIKASHVAGLLAYQILGIECEGEMQGLMLVATAGKTCWLPAQMGKPIVYVHFLATAPWNDPDFTVLPRFGAVGKIFLAAAIQLSIDNGFKGRIGLHSLPQADAFYTGCGMTDLGRDPSPGMQQLRYYEMTPEQAQAFNNRGQK